MWRLFERVGSSRQGVGGCGRGGGGQRRIEGD